jgi:hypothetical protein
MFFEKRQTMTTLAISEALDAVNDKLRSLVEAMLQRFDEVAERARAQRNFAPGHDCRELRELYQATQDMPDSVALVGKLEPAASCRFRLLTLVLAAQKAAKNEYNNYTEAVAPGVAEFLAHLEGLFTKDIPPLLQRLADADYTGPLLETDWAWTAILDPGWVQFKSHPTTATSD